jgi:hypothetical protein
LDRLTQQIDWTGDGTGAGYDRSVTYNAKGQVTGETVISLQGSNTFKSVIANVYGTGTGYALGAVISSTSTNYKLTSGNWVSGDAPNTSTVNTIGWRALRLPAKAGAQDERGR